MDNLNETLPYGYARDMLNKDGLIRWARHWLNAIEQINTVLPMPFREHNPASGLTDHLRHDNLGKLRAAVELLREAAYDDKDVYDIHARGMPAPYRRNGR